MELGEAVAFGKSTCAFFCRDEARLIDSTQRVIEVPAKGVDRLVIRGGRKCVGLLSMASGAVFVSDVDGKYICDMNGLNLTTETMFLYYTAASDRTHEFDVHVYHTDTHMDKIMVPARQVYKYSADIPLRQLIVDAREKTPFTLMLSHKSVGKFEAPTALSVCNKGGECALDKYLTPKMCECTYRTEKNTVELELITDIGAKLSRVEQTYIAVREYPSGVRLTCA